MPKIFVTRKIPEAGISKLKSAGYEVEINPADKVLSKDELISYLKKGKYDAALVLLTDKLDADVFQAAGPQCKIFANMAVGFDNADIEAAKKAKEMGLTVVGFSGLSGGELKQFCDFIFLAGSQKTPHIQEMHITALHAVSEVVEDILFPS